MTVYSVDWNTLKEEEQCIFEWESAYLNPNALGAGDDTVRQDAWFHSYMSY